VSQIIFTHVVAVAPEIIVVVNEEPVEISYTYPLIPPRSKAPLRRKEGALSEVPLVGERSTGIVGATVSVILKFHPELRHQTLPRVSYAYTLR